MAKYLEYDKITGRIISEIISASKPECSGNYGLLEVDSNLEINTALYVIKDGQLVKMYETNEERLERERVRKEHGEKIRRRVKAMMYEVIIALLDENDKALEDLRKEYQSIKGYL